VTATRRTLFGVSDLLGYLVGLRGLEPLTSSLSGKRSNRLSYRPDRAPTSSASARRIGYRKLGLAAQSDSLSVTSMPPVRVVTRLYSAAPTVARAVNRMALMVHTSAVYSSTRDALNQLAALVPG
jgi:hypothetical protein